jgi:hypothetical protein
MPTIRIDEDVFRALQARAVPLVDTPNSVLRRVLDLEPPERQQPRRADTANGGARREEEEPARPGGAARRDPLAWIARRDPQEPPTAAQS